MSVLFVAAVFLVWGLGDLVVDDYFAVRAARRAHRRLDQ